MNRLLTNKWLRHAPYIIQINDPYNRSSLHKHMVQKKKYCSNQFSSTFSRSPILLIHILRETIYRHLLDHITFIFVRISMVGITYENQSTKRYIGWGRRNANEQNKESSPWRFRHNNNKQARQPKTKNNHTIRRTLNSLTLRFHII